jgi:cell division septation protein DedD
MAAKNESWIIIAIVIIAGVLIALSFTKNKSQEPSSAASVAQVAPIKPDHTAADMQEIAAVKTTGAAMVEAPKTTIVKSGFAIQVFSFKDKMRADASLKLLKDKGYPAYVMMSDLGPRGVFYRVRVGSFVTEGEAEKSLLSVTKDFKSGIIVSE